MENITAIIETPRGQGYKIDLDPAEGHFKLKKAMPAGLFLPFEGQRHGGTSQWALYRIFTVKSRSFALDASLWIVYF
jgi:hypothetical protein